MKKIVIIAVSILCVGFVASQFINTEGTKAGEKPIKKSEPMEPIEQVEAAEHPIETNISEFQVEATEFNSLEGFVNSTQRDWTDGSEYRSVYADDRNAELQLSNSVVRYINYFENEIKEAGLSKEFSEWQNVAFEISKHDPENYEELVSEFETSLNMIHTKMNEDTGSK
ncbi:hypothetical protein CVD25_22330 [Bacillus canaveralius]|uniref:Uncharacterized protein n=1 Tax=Bacillus canaveralius TaxID=1403243 RepID=A0A2N5GIW1_9BACI|nr:hypothetical protein [Bacillus canaveralius]PLR80962.1 hypothetical protein CU635_16500 [Bacillus canaveralius]PLR88578.1 hypothetical protein CVD25_22330 [Bacillus canaveralius]